VSLLASLRALELTARTSASTLLDVARGSFTDASCDARLDRWARGLVRAANLEIDVRGAEHARAGEPFVVVSNHASHFDVPIVFCSIPGPLRMVAKKELFRIPVFGEAMQAAGFVRIDRANHRKARGSLDQCIELLRGGTRVWIAPEGTRSRDGTLLPFKSGAFHLAIDAGVRILPVALHGTAEVLRRGEALVHDGKTVRVTILPPVDAPSFGKARRVELTEHVRRSIAGALGT
jgi:1-acyl-sn-glycerol-3-phosphate acyltransferase